MTRPRRTQTPLGVAVGLLLTSLAVSIGLAAAGAPVVARSSVPWLVALTVALIALRVMGARDAGRRAALWFWLGLALTAAAIALSPVFGLYLFIGYYEASQLPGRIQPWAGMVATALVIAVAQTGGVHSPLFTPIFYALFVAVNLAITSLMRFLDREREGLSRELAAANADLLAERERADVLRDQLVEQAREAGIEDERARLSREIHDTVAQDLVAIIAQLDAAQAAPDEAERARRLTIADAAARDALAEARRAVRALASPRLDDSDLPLALDDLLGQWRSATGIDAELRVQGTPAASPHDDDLLRAGQEALANAARHSGAGRVDVTLDYRSDAVALTVRDDGVGFDPDAAPPGSGLTGMRSRLERIGGSVLVESAPGRGATVAARVPRGSEGS